MRRNGITCLGIVYGDIAPENLSLPYINKEVAVLKVVKPLQNLRAVVELVRYMNGIKQMTIQRVELLVITSGAGDDRGDVLTVDTPRKALVIMYVTGEDKIWSSVCSRGCVFYN